VPDETLRHLGLPTRAAEGARAQKAAQAQDEDFGRGMGIGAPSVVADAAICNASENAEVR